jgi:hypothetical protein
MPHRKDRPIRPNYAEAPFTEDQFFASRARFNQATADFLKTDVETALTFAGIALKSDDPIKKIRNRRNARTGYDAVLRLRPKVDLCAGDSRMLAGKLKRLRLELQTLGETF